MTEDFKETNIGMIPKEWELKSAEDFCSKVTDGTHDSPKKKDFGNYLITSRHIKGNNIDFENAYFISKEDYKEVNKRSRVDQWDVLFSMIGTIGETYLETNDMINYAIKNIGLFKSGTENRGKWIYYYLKSFQAQEYIHMNKSGTTQEYITLGALRKFPIAFPQNKTEMEKIIDILYSIDKKIEINLLMNQNLEEIGQAIFKHWFVHFEFPNEEGKHYKSSGGEMVDSELGEIPKGWKIEKLENYVNTIKGCSYKSADLQESNNALVTLKSIGRDGNFKNNGFKEYSGDFREEQLIVDGDVVIAQTDLTQKAEVLGKPVIVRSVPQYKKLIASLDLAIIRPKYDYLNKEFIYGLLKTKTFHSHAVSYANGTTVLHLSKDAVPEYKITIPTKSLIDEFGKIIKPIFEKININNLESENLSESRDLLLPKLMSGKIRVPLRRNNAKRRSSRTGHPIPSPRTKL